MLKNSQIRAKAREALGGNIFSKAWLLALVVYLIVCAANSIASTIVVGSLIISGPLFVGQAKYYLDIRRSNGTPDDITTVFSGFTSDFVQNMLLGILVGIFTFLWSLLFVIPGIVKACAYSMAQYIKVDHPEYTAMEAISASQEMMKGYKMKYFGLMLSFIGWLILGSLACGVGVLWVAPYMESAKAEFYEELKQAKGTTTGTTRI